MGSVKYQLMEEGYLQVVELRGIDPGHKVVQLFASPFDVKLSENGENAWRTLDFVVGATLRRFECNGEIFKPGQHREASRHSLG